MEIKDPLTISEQELKMIKAHLQLAFSDDIDKSYGDEKQQLELTKIHNPEYFDPNQSGV